MPRKSDVILEQSSFPLSLLLCKQHHFIRSVIADLYGVYVKEHDCLFAKLGKVKSSLTYSPCLPSALPNASVKASPSFSAISVMFEYSSIRSPTFSSVRVLSSWQSPAYTIMSKSLMPTCERSRAVMLLPVRSSTLTSALMPYLNVLGLSRLMVTPFFILTLLYENS